MKKEDFLHGKKLQANLLFGRLAPRLSGNFGKTEKFE
jgi:hypothetical protein